jgi:hypothetical protein
MLSYIMYLIIKGWGFWLDSSGSVLRPVAGSCEHVNEPSDPIKSWELLSGERLLASKEGLGSIELHLLIWRYYTKCIGTPGKVWRYNVHCFAYCLGSLCGTERDSGEVSQPREQHRSGPLLRSNQFKLGKGVWSGFAKWSIRVRNARNNVSCQSRCHSNLSCY